MLPEHQPDATISANAGNVSHDLRSTTETAAQQSCSEHPPESVSAADFPERDQAAVDLHEVPIAAWYRWLLFVPGVFFLGLGLLGVLLPGLPTTPFLLLASYFFIRSSPRLNQRLLDSRLFGPLLADWQHRGGIRQHVKLKAISVVTVTVVASAYMSRNSPPLVLVICVAAAVGLIVIARLPTIR